MAAHVWTSGESITASKLNALERKKAFLDGTLNITTLTWNEAVALIEELHIGGYNIMNNIYYIEINGIFYSASSATNLLEKDTSLLA